jgi:hypothetical protein
VTISTSPLMAPTYVMLCGSLEGEACVITRDEEKEEKRLEMKPKDKTGSGSLPPLCQANLDHWRLTKKIAKSDESNSLGRVSETMVRLKKLQDNGKSLVGGVTKGGKRKREEVIEEVFIRGLFLSLAGKQTWDDETVYATVMSCNSTSFFLDTLLEPPPLSSHERRMCVLS